MSGGFGGGGKARTSTSGTTISGGTGNAGDSVPKPGGGGSGGVLGATVGGGSADEPARVRGPNSFDPDPGGTVGADASLQRPGMKLRSSPDRRPC